MTKSEKRNVFIKYLANMYAQNPDLEIKSDTIYYELCKFNVIRDEKIERIFTDSLIGVQLKLSEKYVGRCFSNGYFWVFENRMGNDEKTFYNKLVQSVKLYVAVDSDRESFYKLSDGIFSFMEEENILAQCKIAKEMRSDVLVLRVETMEDAKKVADYINNFVYWLLVKPNPFLLPVNDKVSIAQDGRLSYNTTLSQLLERYFKYKKERQELGNVSDVDFGNFCTEFLGRLKANPEEHIYKLGIANYDKFNDFLMIGKMITEVIDGKLSLENFKQKDEKKENNEEFVFSRDDEDKLLYVMNSMCSYCSLEGVHKLITIYIRTGNVRLFTRKDGIRSIIIDNFPPKRLEALISQMGYSALMSAVRETFIKYGKKQTCFAIDGLMEENDIGRFTNTNNARSYLGFIIPPEMLKNYVSKKVINDGYGTDTVDFIYQMIVRDINRKNSEDDKNLNSRHIENSGSGLRH